MLPTQLQAFTALVTLVLDGSPSVRMERELNKCKSQVVDLRAEIMKIASLKKKIPKEIRTFHSWEKGKCTGILAGEYHSSIANQTVVTYKHFKQHRVW